MRRRDRAWVLSLLLAVCLLYLPFLGNPFFFDDFNFFDGSTPEQYAAGFNFGLRWFALASLGWTDAIFSSYQTYFFHAGNVLIHAASVISLFYLLRKLTAAAIPEQQNTPTLVWGAWLGALIFAIHPVAVYAAGYVIQRSILLATLFVLLMQLAYLHGLLTGRSRWLMVAVAAYFLAVFSKEHSVLAPALLAAETLLLRSQSRASLRTLAATWLAMAAVALLITLRVKGIFGTPYEVGAGALFEKQGTAADSVPMEQLLSVMTQAGLFFKYLGLWLLPNPMWMSVDMRAPFVSSLTQWQGWAGVAGFLAYGFISLRLLLRGRQQGLIGLALFYPWVQFIVEFSTIRIQEPFVLYRSYLWMPGLLLLIPLLMIRWPGRKTLYALSLAALLLVPLSVNRLWVFSSSYRLWNDAAKLLRTGNEPLASRIYYNRGLAEGRLGRWVDASKDYERAIKRNLTEDPIMLHDLGVAYFNTRRYQEALEWIDRAIVLKPDYAKAYYDKGMTLKMLGRKQMAMQQMEKSCKMKYVLACIIVEMNPDKKK